MTHRHTRPPCPPLHFSLWTPQTIVYTGGIHHGGYKPKRFLCELAHCKLASLGDVTVSSRRRTTLSAARILRIAQQTDPRTGQRRTKDIASPRTDQGRFNPLDRPNRILKKRTTQSHRFTSWQAVCRKQPLQHPRREGCVRLPPRPIPPPHASRCHMLPMRRVIMILLLPKQICISVSVCRMCCACGSSQKTNERE